jgi:Replication initiator protein A (RepA) N-terminus
LQFFFVLILWKNIYLILIYISHIDDIIFSNKPGKYKKGETTTIMKNYITNKNIQTKNGKKSVKMEQPFYQVPIAIFQNEKYKKLTPATKILYMHLLDRVGISVVNGMVDDEVRYYVKMSKESAPEIGLNPKTFDEAKKKLVEPGLLEIKEINKRVHHLYVLLPERDDVLDTKSPQLKEKTKEVIEYPNFDKPQSNPKGEEEKMYEFEKFDNHGFGERIKISSDQLLKQKGLLKRNNMHQLNIRKREKQTWKKLKRRKKTKGVLI